MAGFVCDRLQNTSCDMSFLQGCLEANRFIHIDPTEDEYSLWEAEGGLMWLEGMTVYTRHTFPL